MTEILRAKVEAVVDDAARMCNLKVIRCAHAGEIGRPVSTKLYIGFDTTQPRLDPDSPWLQLLQCTFPDTSNAFKVIFQTRRWGPPCGGSGGCGADHRVHRASCGGCDGGGDGPGGTGRVGRQGLGA